MEQDKIAEALDIMSAEANTVAAVGKRAGGGDWFILLKGEPGELFFNIYTAMKYFAQQYDNTFLEILRALLLRAAEDGWLTSEELEIAGVESGDAGEIISKLKNLVKEIQNGN